jgi:hypothetical protein
MPGLLRFVQEGVPRDIPYYLSIHDVSSVGRVVALARGYALGDRPIDTSSKCSYPS